MRKHLAICLLLTFSFSAGLLVPVPEGNAQPESQPLPRAIDTPIRFDNLTIDDGLLQQSVLAIVQDRRGFMWFGTLDGLNRYDGNAFKSYVHDPDDANSPGLGSTQVLFEDSDGLLWIGHEQSGLDCFDPLTETFFHYRHVSDDPTSLSHNRVLALFEDREGVLWVGSWGLNRFNPDTGTFTRILLDAHYPIYDATEEPDNLGNRIYSIHEDRQGVLWVGTGGGLFRYDRITDTFTRYRYDPDDPTSLSDDRVMAVYEDNQGVLWIGAWGLNRFDQETETFERFYLDPEVLNNTPTGINRVMAIQEDHTGVLWIGTNSGNQAVYEGGGLNRFDRALGTFTSYRHDPGDASSLISDEVVELYEDRQGVLYVGASTGGLSRIDRSTRQFDVYRHDPNNPNSLQGGSARAIYLDRDDVLWIGTTGGVLNRLDRRSGLFTHFRNDPDNPYSLGSGSIRAIHRDRQRRFWVGTIGGGLSYLDEGSGRFIRYVHDPDNPNSISSSNVNVIYEDRSGEFWIGTWEGLNHFDPSTGNFIRYLQKSDDATTLNDNTVQAIYEDLSGQMWVGRRSSGLNLFDRNSGLFKHYPYAPADSQSLSSPNIMVFYERPEEPGILWIGTSGGGLNRFDTQTERFTHFTMQNSGLPAPTTTSILIDDESDLWISTDHGIARFDPDENEWTTFGSDDGLQSLEFDWFSSHKGYNGELFFGGIGGVNAIRPSDSFDNPNPPQVVLTGLRLFGELVIPGPESLLETSIMGTESLTLRHDQNDVAFEYVGLHFRNPEKNQYAYMLEPYDSDWRQVKTLRTATYTALSPGNYIFRAKASNSDGVWNEEGTSLIITILPPWWRTGWAYALWALLLFGAVVGAYRIQHARIIRKEREQALIREAELRAEAAELQAKASETQARALKAENDRNRIEAEKARELEKAYNRLKTTQAQLVHSEKMASLGQLTAGIAHEIKNPLNFVNNFGELNVELADELQEEMEARPATRLTEKADILDDMKVNAEQIVLHGKRADGIVNSMMQHARGNSSERESTDINMLLDQYVDLAYHGMRAQHFGFNVTIERAYDETAGSVELLAQEMGRVFLNVINNAFYAVLKRERKEGESYVPTVKMCTKRTDDGVEISVTDNGSGIPSDVKEKIFEPFFTTKPTGEGTGLGLSLAYGIVTQGHGGSMTVESVEGRGTTFIITLPA